MSTDYGEKERQFLETLKADTGRALDDWMGAITAQGLTRRNDIIDWLRRQGFMFSKASWLERIHNNGGRPIYGEGGSPRAQARPRTSVAPRPRIPAPDPPPAAVEPTPPPSPPVPATAASPSAPSAANPAEADPAAIEALLAKAKAYRPLAAFVVTEIRKLQPATLILARDGHLVFRRGDADFAVLAVSPRELRLGLALKDRPSLAGLEAAKFPAALQAPAAITHMIGLTDARQVTPALLDAIRHAAAGAV